MLYAYQYQRHPMRKLHTSVCVFLRNLRYGNPDPANFDINSCCTGELLMRARRGAALRDRLKDFYDVWCGLDNGQREQVYRAFLEVNSIEKQLGNTAPRITLADLPEPSQEVTRDLFVHLYKDSLVKAQVRKHWQEFYDNLPFKACPFCGIEELHHPLNYKQDYDHVLCKATYPFAAVNLRNLVPCGRDCNTIFKDEKDIIFGAGGRRKAFYPFRDYGVQIIVSLVGSRLPSNGEDRGDWRIQFSPDIDEVRTWTEVFELERRYGLEIFGENYTRWIGDFVDWVAWQAIPLGGWTAAEVRQCMDRYRELLATDRIRDRRFLKHALFVFILNENDPATFGGVAAQLNSRNN